MVILKNNKPKYFVADFAEYDEYAAFRAMRMAKLNESADRILAQSMEAFVECERNPDPA